MSARTFAILTSGLVLACACACAPSGDNGSAGGTDGPSFTDVAAVAGLSRQAPPARAFDTILESTGSGVAVGDYDGDGDEDLYFPAQPALADHLAGRPGPPNALYRNDGDGTFTEVAAEAGVALAAWGNAAYFADVDNDGDQDLFLANWGRNALYRNEGDGTFVDVSDAAGVAGGARDWSTSAAFADFDEDGLLDLVVVNYLSFDPAQPVDPGIRPVWNGEPVWVGPQGLPGQYDAIYRNAGGGAFVELTAQSGLLDQAGLYGLGVIAQDLDLDEDIDLYVANDSTVNQLWRNDVTLPFREVAAASATAVNESGVEQAGHGVDCGDVNDDGLIDLIVTNFDRDWDTLYLNEGGMRFRDGTFEAAFGGQWNSMGWGVKFFDYDHDGRLDLGIADGHVYASGGAELAQPDRLLRNAGDGRFEAVDDDAWAAPAISRGLAVFDYDRDGDLDVVRTHLDAPPSLLRNDGGNARNWIAFRLEGVRSNRDGVGARLRIEAGGETRIRLVQPYGSFQSQSTMWVHVGLGDTRFVDTLRIYWPRGRELEYTDLQANRFYTIREDSGISRVEDPAGGGR